MLYKMLFDIYSLVYFHKLVGNYKLVVDKYILHIHKMSIDLMVKLVNWNSLLLSYFFFYLFYFLVSFYFRLVLNFGFDILVNSYMLLSTLFDNYMLDMHV